MRSRSYAMAVTTALALVVTVSSLAQSATPTTKRVSVRSNGTQADDHSLNPAISGNGRFVAFRSYASNLVAGDSNDDSDIFVHDRETNKTERVSVRSNGTQADGFSGDPAISGNGRFVAFVSNATNLVAGDTNDDSDIFVHDRETNKTNRVNVRSNGAEADNFSDAPAISGNGRFVAFRSGSSNLVGGDTNGVPDVFVHDRKTKETKRVSVSSNGTEGDGFSNDPAISGNGRFVAFNSNATNLVAGDTNDTDDIFVHDRETKETKRVSVHSNGAQAQAVEGSNDPAISGNGRFVAFVSDATNLVAGDTNGTADVFMHDRETKKTKRVSVRSNGAQGDDFSLNPGISGNGRFVAFDSRATNLVAGDTNNRVDVFVRGPLH